MCPLSALLLSIFLLNCKRIIAANIVYSNNKTGGYVVKYAENVSRHSDKMVIDLIQIGLPCTARNLMFLSYLKMYTWICKSSANSNRVVAVAMRRKQNTSSLPRCPHKQRSALGPTAPIRNWDLHQLPRDF
jgi:hypothetical protein